MNFDYYYGDESNQFAFYRIPRQLITGEAFKKLSTDAKLLYGLLLDRMGLSAKNGWYDDMGRVFIYYTLDEIQEDLNCGHEKAVRLLAELDTGKKGFGLIERVKQGQGRPTKIYVKRFTTRTIPPQPPAPQDIPRLPIFGSQDFGKAEVKSSEKQKSRLPVIGSADFRKSDTSYIESNQTDLSQLYPSIHPSATVPESRWIDRSECRREVQEAIEFPLLCQQFGYEDVESVTELIVDTLCSTRPTFRIGGAEMPAEQVKGRLQMLDNGHLEYVFDCMRRNTTEIRNIRAYLLTALYNAPVTMSPYYQAAVQHVEKARAYQMKTDAMKRKMGRRTKEEIAQDEALGIKRMNADEELAQQVGESPATIQRYKTLNKLVPELQDLVDKGKIPVNTGADIAQMKPKEQKVLADAIQKEDKVPSGTKAKELKKESQAGSLTTEKIEQAVAPTKREETPPLKVTMLEEDLRPFFPDKRTTIPDVKQGILEGLKLRQTVMERQKAKAAAGKTVKKAETPTR